MFLSVESLEYYKKQKTGSAFQDQGGDAIKTANLMSQDECAKENAMKTPVFRLNGQVGPCPPHVDEGDEDVGDAHFGGI